MAYQPFCNPQVQKGAGFAEFIEKKTPKSKKKKAKSLGVVKVENQTGKGKRRRKKSINIKKKLTCQNFALRNSKYAKTKRKK